MTTHITQSKIIETMNLSISLDSRKEIDNICSDINYVLGDHVCQHLTRTLNELLESIYTQIQKLKNEK